MAKITTPTFKLMVYGTLKKGECREHVLEDEKFLGEVKTEQRYKLLHLGGYPGLVRVENDPRQVHGELYEVRSGLLPRLDAIEGSPNLFRLEEIEVEGVDGPVYSYFFKMRIDNPKVIEENRW